MALRNKTYIAFDGDNDIHYYRLMIAWKHNQNSFFKDFSFYDAHEMNYARDDSQEESIKRQLLERLNASNRFILLIGDSTRYLYKFVKWEIEQAIKQQIPIIAVNLSGKRSRDSELCPPVLSEELAVHISFNQKIIEHALDNWPASDVQYRAAGKAGPYYYKDSIYTSLGL